MGADARAGVREQLAQLRAEEGAMADFRERLGATVAAMRCGPPPCPPRRWEGRSWAQLNPSWKPRGFAA